MTAISTPPIGGESHGDQVRWGVIGVGGISRQIVPDLRLVSNAQLVGVSSRSSAKAEAFAAEFNVPHAYGSLDDLLAGDIDAVYIGTPMDSHFDVALRAIEQGKHVLCEKSFTLTADEARGLARRASARRVFLMEAMWLRFSPAIQQVNALVQSGAIGELKAVFAGFGLHVPEEPGSRRWNSTGGGALLDLGVYPVTLAHLLLGKPETIDARGQITSEGVDVTVAAHLGSPGGRYAQIMTSLDHFVLPTAILAGTEGTITLEYPFYNAPAFTIASPKRKERIEVAREGIGYVPMLRAATESILAGKLESDINPLEFTIDTLETMDAIRSQIKSQSLSASKCL